ncbi:4738_t:CDS:2 [Cetraspora pellucida]|uniref:4738_t:CDS:1 n=1 Tax=Cetraspora pellucida TaxID=1433469 RepID=A0ACA9N034_9GLOM|nr:4738_t:CDS:2 [Cetraspora pellucida]
MDEPILELVSEEKVEQVSSNTLSNVPTANEYNILYIGKTFLSWDCCESFLKEWAKKQDFCVIKDWVHQEEDIVRQ